MGYPVAAGGWSTFTSSAGRHDQQRGEREGLTRRARARLVRARSNQRSIDDIDDTVLLVSGLLQSASYDGGDARCVGCGAQAVGPCARCHAPLCGDCCVITTGGVKTWAVCPACARRGGRSLSRAWWQLAMWVAGLLAALAALVALLELLVR
jgi:hypothetical protein